MRTRTRRRMLALVRQWETSDETRRGFANRHGVTLSCLDYWRRQMRDARHETPVGFAPVQVVSEESGAAASVIDVIFATGERVAIREGASAELVRRVVAALRGSC